MILIYLGIKARFSSTSVGKQINEEESNVEENEDEINKKAPKEVGNHSPCVDVGLINKFKNSKFTEYLIEVDRNKYIYSEDREERLFSFGEVMQDVKKELVYVEN